MSDTTSNPESGLTRRELLKKGAVLGGALVWAAPVVQVIGMRPAMAQAVSSVCPNLYCLKAEVSGGSLGSFGPLGGGQGQGKGNCLKSPEDCDPNVPESILKWLDEHWTGDPETGFIVTLPPGCRLAELSGGSEDHFGRSGVAAATKCGRGHESGPCIQAELAGNDLTFACDEGDVSHIELIICCPAV